MNEDINGKKTDRFDWISAETALPENRSTVVVCIEEESANGHERREWFSLGVRFDGKWYHSDDLEARIEQTRSMPGDVEYRHRVVCWSRIPMPRFKRIHVAGTSFRNVNGGHE